MRRVCADAGCLGKMAAVIESREIQEELLVHMRNILHWDAEAGKI